MTKKNIFKNFFYNKIQISSIFLFQQIFLFSNVFSQDDSCIIYSLNLGYFNSSKLNSVYAYTNNLKYNTIAIRVKNNIFRVIIGKENCYYKLLPLLEKIQKDGFYTHEIYICAFNCMKEINIEEANQITAMRCDTNEIKNINQDETINYIVPDSQNGTFGCDSIRYRVLAWMYSNSIPDSVFDYLSNNFPKEKVFIYSLPTGEQQTLYRLMIGDFECYNKAVSIQQKLANDGYKPNVDTDKIAVHFYKCWRKLCGKEFEEILVNIPNENCN